ncbi:MAG: hypothetical protein ACPL3B_06205 [Fervidobacterium sp.]
MSEEEMEKEVEEEVENERDRRNFFLDISNIDLNTIEGQNYIVIECEKALLTRKLTSKDIQAIKLVKDMIKTKKDLDTLRMYIELKLEIDKLKEQFEKVK